ncbi:MAG: hypothetical protein QG623_353 [Patescibacteria group bacterium]|nr:hypothetical protein [Patescibacteria group bacterium]
MSDKELQELGEKLKEFYEIGYINKWKTLRFTLLKGVAQGLGLFIGGTVVVALVIWALSAIDTVPLVQPVVDNLQRSTGN